MPYANANGVKLFYEVLGSGTEPMVLLGGGGLGRHNFDPVLPYLLEHFTLLSVDQRGYGLSEPRDLETATVDTYADDAVALMDVLKWPSAHLHGTSLGGQVALAIGIRYPARAKSIVANACFAKADVAMRLLFQVMEDYPRRIGKMERAVAGMVAGLFLSPSYLQAHPDVDQDTLLPRLDRSQISAWLNGMRAMREVDLSSGLPTCRVPTLVIAGDSGRNGYALDLEPPGLGLRQIAETMPNGELLILEHSSHLTIVEAAERHGRAVVRFADQLRQ